MHPPSHISSAVNAAVIIMDVILIRSSVAWPLLDIININEGHTFDTSVDTNFSSRLFRYFSFFFVAGWECDVVRRCMGV